MVIQGNGKIFLKCLKKWDYNVLSISVGINGLILLTQRSLISHGLNPNSSHFSANTKSTVHNGAKSREACQEGIQPLIKNPNPDKEYLLQYPPKHSSFNIKTFQVGGGKIDKIFK